LVDLRSEDVYELDERYLRPAEVDLLLGDASKAKERLGWQPEVDFDQLARIMMSADLEAVGVDPRDFGLEIAPEKATCLMGGEL
ncbi:MAG: GDP-mannose 4,6-dehydratase, partial [Planctomycetota bacterium]